MVQVSLLLHLLWKDKTDNTRYSLAEEGSGLEGQLQCWSATQVISGSGTQGKLKTQPHFPARLGKNRSNAAPNSQKKKSPCLYMSQNQINNFCQRMTLVLSHCTAHGGILSKASLSTHCRAKQQ